MQPQFIIQDMGCHKDYGLKWVFMIGIQFSLKHNPEKYP